MGDHDTHKHLTHIEHLIDRIEHQIDHIERELHKLTHPSHRTATARVSLGGSMATSGTNVVGTTITATFQPLLADGVTVNTATTLSTPPTWSSSDATVATVTPNADGSAAVLGVGAGTATITASQGSFTDADGVVVGPLDASNDVSDTGGGTSQRTVSAQISFA